MNCKCNVEQRRLTPGVFNLKQFLNGSETMVWEVDNSIINEGTCDLRDYDAFLTLCVGGEIDEILLTKRQTGNKLQLIWNVGTYATALAGYVKYQIVFRSATFDTLGVIADDSEANGVYSLVDVNTSDTERVFSQAENGYSIKWDAENGRWTLYQADGATVVDYQTTPNTEPHCGTWGNTAVGNNEAAAWISDEAIMYVSDSIAADQKVTGNYPTILRQLWAKIAKAGVTSVNGKVGIVELSPADIGAAEDDHTHQIADTEGLQDALNGKSNTDHTHTTADVTGLQDALNSKANTSHAHQIADTEGLQDALNGKAPTEHGHIIGNVTGLQDALNNKAPATHTETKATTSALGHVKIDGQTITVADDGTIKANGGVAIGTIFPFPASVPPGGAYLLNGQTITNCASLYPKFWEWLMDNAGRRPIYKAWTMPALTADGTLGGTEYAVEASRAMADDDHAAYKSFDGTHGGARTFARLDRTEKTGYLTWYSPVTLKVSQIVFQNATAVSAGELVKTFEILGSNDNQTWHSLTSGTIASTVPSATQIEDIPESKYGVDNPGYKYFKFDVVNGGGGAGIHFPEITIYGQEYLYTDYAGNGNILTLTNEAYEYILSRTGVCGGFVIDSASGSVRLPTVVNGTLWGADSTTIGESLAAGLPNITGTVVSSHDGKNEAGYSGAFSIGDEISGASGGGTDRVAVFDASLSNPIYGNSDTVQPPAVRVAWCIQVYNAATALSEQESAQLASEMQTKAQTDLANVDSNIDYVVESWDDGAGGWYRKYRSGWVEQGGILPQPSALRAVTVNFWLEMLDTNYTPNVTQTSKTTVSTTFTPRVHSCFNLTTTTMDVMNFETSIQGTRWEVKGFMSTGGGDTGGGEGDTEGDTEGSETPTAYIVSGAGSTEYNGTYDYYDEHNGKPRYMMPGIGVSVYLYWNTTSSAWEIFAMSTAYACTGETPDSGTWQCVGGTAPAPTVTATGDGSGGGNDSDGDDSGEEILGYTVSGSGMMDGEYELTALQSGYSADPRVFSNGTYYLARFTDVGGWYFATTYNNNFDVTQYCKAYDANNIPANDQAAAAATAEPSDVAYWWDLEVFTSKTYSVTPIYGEDVGGDTESGETGEILGYNVAGSGLTAANGYYEYGGEYNSKPYYTLTASDTTYYLYYYGGQTGWAINSSLSIGGPPMFYQWSDEATPDAGMWKAMASTPPTSITPVYE